MTDELEKHVLKKYDIAAKLGKGVCIYCHEWRARALLSASTARNEFERADRLRM